MNIHANLTPLFLLFNFQLISANALVKYFMRKILLDFLTLWPCCSEAVISVSAGIECVHPHIHRQNVTQTHATDLFLVDLLLSNSYKGKIPLCGGHVAYDSYISLTYFF